MQHQSADNLDEKYYRYESMDPTPPPTAPIHPFFQGTPQLVDPTLRYDDAHERVIPVIYVEDSWTESVVFHAEHLSSSETRRFRSTISSDMIGGSRFTLTHPLRKGYNRWSQTWLGCMSLPTDAIITVVIKLFQESRFPIEEPDSDSESGSKPSAPEKGQITFNKGARYSSAEANAYRCLKNLQGGVHAFPSYRL